MKANGILAFLTDFGLEDWYVASMKGAALRINPSLTLIDISHAVQPGSIEDGAFLLRRCYDDFPPGTTFVVVVDPGVGTERDPIIVETENYCFVAPDNGVLYPSLVHQTILQQVCIESKTWSGCKTSATFHGRDIFAPAAAKAASDNEIAEAGPPIGDLMPLAFPKPRGEKEAILGQILYFDRFGNGLTNFLPEHLDQEHLEGLRVEDTFFPKVNTFGEVDEGAPLSYWGSSGFLEVAVRDGNAQKEHGLKRHSVVGPVYQGGSLLRGGLKSGNV